MADSAEDPFDLQRFVAAQDGVIDDALAELAAGAKTRHWMWFVFPQLKTLGRSTTARYFGLASLDEARAYWRHPVLGGRLRACAEQLERLHGRSAREIFGAIDTLKLRSCLTLFEQAAPGEPLFGRLLDRYFASERDPITLELLRGGGPSR